MSNRNFSYIFSPDLLWGNVSSQSETGLCNLQWSKLGSITKDKLKSRKTIVFLLIMHIMPLTAIRDGPFDIHGGG